jgi:hypothetical protein
MAEFTEINARRYMRNVAYMYEDATTGEVDITALAVAAAHAFGQGDINGCLDDESHWIWEAAARFSSN